MLSNKNFIKILKGKKENPNLTEDDLIFNWNHWVLEPYKIFSEQLVRQTSKVIEKVDFKAEEKQMEKWFKLIKESAAIVKKE
jgi:hypothetical protein